MIFAPKALGNKKLSDDVLSRDRKSCIRIGPCGCGGKAVYLNSFYISRRYYLAYGDIERIYKRIAMSKGGFTGKGLFGTMAYLVAEYGGGKEKQCNFKNEADIDAMLSWIEREHPEIPVHSRAAEIKLEEAENAERSRYVKELSPKAEKSIKRLEEAKEYLERKREISDTLSDTAKQKRIADGIKPFVRIMAMIFAVLSITAVMIGIGAILAKLDFGMYLAIVGGVLFMFVLTSGLLPSRWNNPKSALADWKGAVNASGRYIGDFRDFPVPPQYAHPVVLQRMLSVIREGRAESVGEALDKVKEDLKALNSSVTVSQKEHDEVAAVKPMFLVCDYKDEI